MDRLCRHCIIAVIIIRLRSGFHGVDGHGHRHGERSALIENVFNAYRWNLDP